MMSARQWYGSNGLQTTAISEPRSLSDVYLSGRDVPRDYVRAYTWASIAAGPRGDDNDRLKVIESRMTAVQIEDAHRRISRWWEHQRRRAATPATSQRTTTL